MQGRTFCIMMLLMISPSVRGMGKAFRQEVEYALYVHLNSLENLADLNLYCSKIVKYKQRCHDLKSYSALDEADYIWPMTYIVGSQKTNLENSERRHEHALNKIYFAIRLLKMQNADHSILMPLDAEDFRRGCLENGESDTCEKALLQVQNNMYSSTLEQLNRIAKEEQGRPLKNPIGLLFATMYCTKREKTRVSDCLRKIEIRQFL